VIQSIDRAAKILSLLQGARRLGVTELGAALELPPSTVHGIVKSLQSHGLVAQERGGNRYMLGPALVKLSSVYLDTLDVRARSIRWMHDLSRETGFATRLGVELFGEVLIIHHDRRPDGSEQMPETGLTIPSHASALGKVLLALDADHRRDALERPVRTLTGSTVTDAAQLEAEFDRVRRELLGYELEEAVIGENSVAAPVYDSSGAAVAALAIVVPSAEWPPPGAALSQLGDAARNISRELGAPGR
jgi:DNA-binding IclR family transcriptional regulator